MARSSIHTSAPPRSADPAKAPATGASEGAAARSVGARYRWARQRLAGAQKSTKAIPAYLRYVNRPIGGRLACVGYALRLSPTQLTAASALVSGAGLAVLAFARATVTVGVLVAVALAAGYALDSADGQLARIRGGGTRAGEWLDHVLDVAKLSLMHLCVLIAWYRWFDLDHAALLLIPLGFLLVQAISLFASMLRDQLRQAEGLSGQPPSEHGSLLASLVLQPMDHGTVCWLFVLLGWHPTFVVAYAAVGALTAAFTVRGLVRSYRNLRRVDAGRAQ